MSPLHEGYAAAIGRGLVVCQHIESCAHHAGVVYAVTDALRDGVSDSTDLPGVAIRHRSASLGRTIQRLEASGDFERFGNALQTGRNARNWLVHEAADVVGAAYSIQGVLERVRQFREQVAALCEADRILSVVSYEICEREPAPSTLSGIYAAKLAEWIMDPIINGIGSLADSPSPGDS